MPPITAYTRNSTSGTTEAFKNAIG